MLDLIQYTGPIAPIIQQLTYGPEFLIAPVGLLLAIAAILVGHRELQTARPHEPRSQTLARIGSALGWTSLALYAVTLILVALSFSGVVKPLI